MCVRDHYFNTGYFLAGNEPGFAMPLAYHYANRPDLSALRMRNVVYTNFGTGIGGVSSIPISLSPIHTHTPPELLS